MTCLLNADINSCTASRLKLDFPSLIKKDDQNHVKKKRISKPIHALGKLYKDLNADAIDYFVRCFMYAICDNQGSVIKIQEALLYTVPHIYGDHTACENMHSCRYKQIQSHTGT